MQVVCVRSDLHGRLHQWCPTRLHFFMWRPLDLLAFCILLFVRKFATAFRLALSPSITSRGLPERTDPLPHRSDRDLSDGFLPTPARTFGICAFQVGLLRLHESASQNTRNSCNLFCHLPIAMSPPSRQARVCWLLPSICWTLCIP